MANENKASEITTYNPNEESLVIYRTEDNTLQLDVQVADETVWLSQQQMVALFDSTKQNISLHINYIFKEGELDKEATVKEYLTVQTEGSRQVARKVLYYNLDVIISVGYRVKSLWALTEGHGQETLCYYPDWHKPGGYTETCDMKFKVANCDFERGNRYKRLLILDTATIVFPPHFCARNLFFR